MSETCRHCEPAVPVYPAEEQLGLADAVRAGVLYLTAAAEHDPTAELPPAVLASLLATAGAAQPDLYPVKAVLVSTGLNLNDDYFPAEDLWAARATPAHKPFNDEHNAAHIIGHMAAAVPFVYGGESGTELVEIAEPAPDFHVAFSGFVYRFLPGAEAEQERLDNAVRAIQAGERAVSMECRFFDFDYVLIPFRNGKADVASARIVPRTADTAHMTRSLRAFGGSGVYQGYKIARALRRFMFTGVGLVKTPANPASVILSHGDAAAGYEPDSDTPKEQSMNEEALKAELAAAKEATAKAAADLAAAKAELAAAKDTIKAHEAASAAAKAEAEAAKAALAKAEADKQLAVRTAKLKDAYGVSDEEAGKAAANLAALTDEAFEAHLTSVAAIKMSAVKLAEAPMTGKPAPMAGGFKEVKTVAIASDLLETPPPAQPAAPALAVAHADPTADLVKAAAEELLKFRADAPKKSGK